MTAAATTSRPTLYLLPGGVRGAPVVEAGTLGSFDAVAAETTARVLGTLFALPGRRLARELRERAPLLVRRSRVDLWAAAIAFLLAEEARLFEFDCCVTRTSLARELGSTLPTLRRRADAIRTALHPLVVDLPDPEGGYPCLNTS